MDYNSIRVMASHMVCIETERPQTSGYACGFSFVVEDSYT